MSSLRQTPGEPVILKGNQAVVAGQLGVSARSPSRPSRFGSYWELYRPRLCVISTFGDDSLRESTTTYLVRRVSDIIGTHQGVCRRGYRDSRSQGKG